MDSLSDSIDTLKWYDVSLLLPALVLMAIGYKDRGKYTPLLRAGGFVAFSAYWVSQVFHFMDPGSTDIINAAFSLGGVLFYLFMAVHLVLDQVWGERTRSLEWLVRVSVLTGGAYFVFEHIPMSQGAMIYIVAWLTYFTLRLFGHNVSIQGGFPEEVGGGLMIPSGDPSDIPVRIVFACTAALALFLFLSAVIASRTDRKEWEPWARKELKRLSARDSPLARSKVSGLKNLLRLSDGQRKLRAVLIVIPLIFFTNIFRNVGVIAVVYGELISFEDAHNIYAKLLSLGMMLFLTWVLFENLPELQEDIMGLFDLTKRVRKGMIVKGRLDLKYIQAKR